MNNWKRYELKERAKKVLKINYWIAFVVALIFIIINGGGIGSSNTSWKNSYHTNNKMEIMNEDKWDSMWNNKWDENYDSFAEFVEEFPDDMKDGFYFDKDFEADEALGFVRSVLPFVLGIIFIVAFIAILISIALSVFLLNPLKMGCKTFFKTSAEEPHRNMRFLGQAFKGGNYGSVIKTMFLRDLYTFLWSLLLIIPGIIKTYSYRMVPYILADNPKMNTADAILLSRQMMNGEKWKAFVLDLSFFGWYVLGFIVLGVITWATFGLAAVIIASILASLAGLSIVFVMPYYLSTDAQLYLVLKGKALHNGFASDEQLNLPEVTA